MIYYHGSPDKGGPVAEHTIVVCPAGHLPGSFVDNKDWWDDTGEKKKPKEFQVKFYHGEAEVEDALGKYMVASGLAMKTRYSPANFWSPSRG